MRLSIIIAAYNVDAFIEKCVISCYAQDFQNLYEVLVIDDGFTDKTLETLE